MFIVLFFTSCIYALMDLQWLINLQPWNRELFWGRAKIAQKVASVKRSCELRKWKAREREKTWCGVSEREIIGRQKIKGMKKHAIVKKTQASSTFFSLSHSLALFCSPFHSSIPLDLIFLWLFFYYYDY